MTGNYDDVTWVAELCDWQGGEWGCAATKDSICLNLSKNYDPFLNSIHTS
jgi:hypothetical protein